MGRNTTFAESLKKKKMMKRIAFFAIFMLAIGVSSFAQDKYGHLNFGNLISAMPATKSANSELEAYQKQLVAKGEDMAKKFQAEYQQLVADAQSGDETPANLQKREAALQKKQQEIVAYEQEVAQKVQKKRNELLEPIIQQAEAAIDEVAKANGYKMIFDSSVFNSILFAQDSDDIMPLVAKKLGVTVPSK